MTLTPAHWTIDHREQISSAETAPKEGLSEEIPYAFGWHLLHGADDWHEYETVEPLGSRDAFGSYSDYSPVDTHRNTLYDFNDIRRALVQYYYHLNTLRRRPLSTVYVTVPGQVGSSSESRPSKLTTKTILASKTTDELSLVSIVELMASFLAIVHENADEIYEDGVESLLSQYIHASIGKYGNAAVSAWGQLIGLESVNVESVEEILRHIGVMDGRETKEHRLSVLISSLQSSNPRIRDAASLGIAAMDDPDALRDVEKAFDREQSEQLKANIGLVAEQLRATQWLAI
ncbi:MAG: HEAT repeat domain-containing protein [Chloroflexota bacterium]|nr:HEAT repeat domain-containing protein [Chloroflexota bacterium]MDE2885828.1 HEAT repeat domain-containing protein [Chloroflexota bacterium]